MNIKEFGNEKMPSILKDPFNKNSFKSIVVKFEPNIFREGNWEASGVVRFRNGNTEGTQRFNAPTFDEVVIQIKEFINSID